ncbi:8-oxoguanine DNA glycosylase OGG fold protein [Tersicoccus phoenicis]|uniref:8-oxoguanine DNA glycosylase OGG fold protein n=1 Tax=Tersicoccus phoenicis TaxID=554083 RepID=UPI001181563E|nr:hypothetical protein [Tersicoccus phoenicis]
MTALPSDLRVRFDEWNAQGRPQQEAFAWRRSKWREALANRGLPERPVLEALPDEVDRKSVVEHFQVIETPDAALDAFMASYVWGYAHANNGPFRAARAVASNTENGRDFGSELLQLARIAQTDGGLAAYNWAGAARKQDPSFFRYWGPAFGTKFISFATIAASGQGSVAITPIMDAVVARWFTANAQDVQRLNLYWTATASYQRYVDAMAEWSGVLEITPDEVEQLIFRRR